MALLKTWTLIGLAALTFIWVIYFLAKRFNVSIPALSA
jgi:hypothetical protein